METLYLRIKPYVDSKEIILKTTLNELLSRELGKFEDILVVYQELSALAKGAGLVDLVGVLPKSDFNVNSFKKILIEKGSLTLQMPVLQGVIIDALKYTEGYVSNFIKEDIEEHLWLFGGIHKANKNTMENLLGKVFALNDDSGHEMGVLSYTTSKGDLVNIETSIQLKGFNQAKLMELIDSSLFNDGDREILYMIMKSKLGFAKKKKLVLDNALLCFNGNTYDILGDYDKVVKG